jgi:hypothetical protein
MKLIPLLLLLCAVQACGQDTTHVKQNWYYRWSYYDTRNGDSGWGENTVCVDHKPTRKEIINWIIVFFEAPQRKRVLSLMHTGYTFGLYLLTCSRNDPKPVVKVEPPKLIDVGSHMDSVNNKLLKFLHYYQCNRDDMALMDQAQIRYYYTGSKRDKKLFYFYQDRANFYVHEQQILNIGSK